MKLKALLSALLVAGIATSLAVASPPRKGAESGATTTTSTSPAGNRGGSAEARRPPVVMLVLKGEFVSADGDSFAMLVKHSNKHARLLRGKQVTVKVDAKTRIRRQGKGKAQLSDLVEGDRLHVLVRAKKDAASAASIDLLARQVFARPAQTETADDGDTTGTTTSSSTTTGTTSSTA